MLETDAKTKLCPWKMSGGKGYYCEGTACMAWDEWTEQVRDDTKMLVGVRPKVPPEGHCAMIPPDPQV